MGRLGRGRLQGHGGAALTPARRGCGSGLLLTLAAAATLVGCGDGEPARVGPTAPVTSGVAEPPVPEPFRSACGRPGSRVELPEPARPYVVPGARCDLTGVTVSYAGRGGAVVPPPGEGVSAVGDGPGAEGGLEIMSDARTGDVTIRPVD